MSSQITLSGLFVSATQTGYDVYAKLKPVEKKFDCSVVLVNVGDMSCADGDVVICSSFQSLMAIKEYLNEDMIVIVCDTPLILSCMATATPLDYVRKVSYRFEFQPIDLRPVTASLVAKRRNKPMRVVLDAHSYDVIGMVTESSMTGDAILTELNKVQSYFDALTRNRLRYLFIQLFDNKVDTKSVAKELQDFLRTECVDAQHRTAAIELLHKLFKEGVFKRLRGAMHALSEGKSVSYAAKKYEISEFEINYIRRMYKSVDTAAARTEGYANRIKGISASLAM